MENTQRVGLTTPTSKNRDCDSRDRRLRQNGEKRISDSNNKVYAQRLPIPLSRGVVRYLPVLNLDWIEAANQYVRIHTNGRSYLMRDSLARVEALLPPSLFLRVHRSAIVQLARVSELRVASFTHRWLVLSNGQRVPVSQKRWKELRAAMLALH